VKGILDPLSYLDGWCLGGMRDDLNRLRGFDETLTEPAYFSDNDLCLRARCLGMTLRECRIPLHHKLSVTTGGTSMDPALQAVMSSNYRQYADRARTLLASVAV
jgi:GT2 family glycosyltransferase